MIETLMFYHPAVWYIARRIRADRENCCDDIVVAVCGDQGEYAEALVACSGLGMPMAMAASEGNLLPRLQRILAITPGRSTRSGLWPAAVALLFVAGLVMIALGASGTGQRETPLSPTSSLAPAAATAHAPATQSSERGPSGIQTPTISRVATAAELKALDPIDVGSSRIRLGIESDTCNIGEGVLVYVLVEKWGDDKVSTTWQSGKTVGPVVVEIKRIREPGEKDLLEPRARGKGAIAVGKRKLYVCPVWPGKAGKYEISVRPPDGGTAAKTILTVSNEKVQPWFPLVSVGEEKPLADKNAGDLEMTVGSMGVVPDWPTDEPLMLPEKALPRAMPDGAGDDAFKIAIADGIVSVHVSHWREKKVGGALAVRLWVDDKPVLAKGKSRSKIMDSASGGHDVIDAEVNFALRLHLGGTGIKEGDKVTLQLCYSQAQWQATPKSDALRSEKMINEMPDPPLVSNKVTFKATAEQCKMVTQDN